MPLAYHIQPGAATPGPAQGFATRAGPIAWVCSLPLYDAPSRLAVTPNPDLPESSLAIPNTSFRNSRTMVICGTCRYTRAANRYRSRHGTRPGQESWRKTHTAICLLQYLSHVCRWIQEGAAR